MPSNFAPASSLGPIRFELSSETRENVLFSMGSPHPIRIEITNTGRTDLTIPGDPHGPATPEDAVLALVFRPGILAVDTETRVQTSGTAFMAWHSHIVKSRTDQTERILFKTADDIKLAPNASLTLTMHNLKIASTGGSHGTIVQLEVNGIRQPGTAAPLSMVKTHRIDVLQQAPFNFEKLDTLVGKSQTTIDGLSKEQQAIGKAVAALSARAVVPLQAFATSSDILPMGKTTQLHIRLRSNLGEDEGTLQILKDAKIEVTLPDDAQITETIASEVDTAKTQSVWKSSGVPVMHGAVVTSPFDLDVGSASGPNRGLGIDLAMRITTPEKHTTLLLEITCTQLAVRQQTTDSRGAKKAETIPLPTTTLVVPVHLRALYPHKSGVDITGELDLSGVMTLAEIPSFDVANKKPLRLFQDHGWNFTIANDPTSGFRIGPQSAHGKEGMTALTVTTRGTTLGSEKNPQQTELSLRGGSEHGSAISLQSGATKFKIEAHSKNGGGLHIGPTGKFGLTILQSNGNVGVGALKPVHPLVVEGHAKFGSTEATTVTASQVDVQKDLNSKGTTTLHGDVTIKNQDASIRFSKSPKYGPAKIGILNKKDALMIETKGIGFSAGLSMNQDGINHWTTGDSGDLFRIFRTRHSNKGLLTEEMLALSANGSLSVKGALTVWQNMEIVGKPGLSDFNQSNGVTNNIHNGKVENSGYQFIGSFLIQWGTITSTSNKSEKFFFPRSFSVKPLVMLNREHGRDNVGVSTAHKASFTVKRGSIGGSESFTWIAIGAGKAWK